MFQFQYEFKPVRTKPALKLNTKQATLLKMIGSLGFVNTDQIDLPWSVIVKYPTHLSHAILAKWAHQAGFEQAELGFYLPALIQRHAIYPLGLAFKGCQLKRRKTKPKGGKTKQAIISKSQYSRLLS